MQHRKSGRNGKVNLFVTVLVLVAGTLVVALPRRWAVIPFIIVAPLIPSGQLVEVGAFHFYVNRILLVVLLVRVVVRLEYRDLKRSPVDTLMIAQFLCGTLAFIILRGTFSAFINRLGWVYDGLGIYFLMRWTIRDLVTWRRVLTAFAFICVVMSVLMLIEKRTDKNMFSVLGGVPAFTEIREGKIRAQGPFGHPILAGVFAANLLPLLVSMGWLGSRSRVFQGMGLAAAVVIVVASASSTPIMCCAFGVIGLLAWSIRRNMRLIRWAMFGGLILLQMVMNNPVWSIVAKFRVVGGSTGYYRFWLLDNFIRRIGEWWLLGVESTAKWGYGLWDVTNMYVRVGVDGGLITLVLFLAVIVKSYKLVGRLVIDMQGSPPARKAVWALGAAFTGHLAAFFGVNYWDQNVVPWYLLLAMIAGSREIFGKSVSRTERRSVPQNIPARLSSSGFEVPLADDLAEYCP